MSPRSSFAPGGNGMTRGGLDRYLGPAAIDDSNLPAALESPDQPAEPERPVDCQGTDKDEAVCQIAAAEKSVTRGQ